MPKKPGKIIRKKEWRFLHMHKNAAISAVFLYTELAAYTIACLKDLSARGVKITVMRYPVNKEAPFQFDLPAEIQFTNSRELSYAELETAVENANPSVIFCSGWIDKNYLKICKKYSGKIPTVLAFDTHWRGDIRQVIASLISPFYLKRKFSHAWVPGEVQKKYAMKLGFLPDKIYKGFYCADTDHFGELYKKFRNKKENAFPKRFLYVGRYYDFKGIRDLWKAFAELHEEQPNEWELWCLGTGDIEPVEHPFIRHFGFVQPDKMDAFISESGVFVLPSHFEPWAVAVHEFACCGFPLVCSSAVGAGEQFIAEGRNGYTFRSADVRELKEKLRQVINLPAETLNLMGERSTELAATITLKSWSETVLHIAGKV